MADGMSSRPVGLTFSERQARASCLAREGWSHLRSCSRCLTLPAGVEVAAIAETVEQPWPRLDGEHPSEAHHWADQGFGDAEVVAWLEAGVPWATSAAQLRDAAVEPRDVARLDGEVTLGLRFARGEMTLAAVQRRVLGEEDPR